MDIENKIFQKTKPNYNLLEQNGFIKENKEYKYSKLLSNNEFRVDIIIKENNIIGKVIDLDTNEEYTNIRLKNLGQYSNKIKEEYENILIDIREKCFIKEYFISNQANRITKYIIDKYQTEPEFLWDNNKGSGVFRNKDNKKWFSIIMDINKSRIDKEDKIVEIINTKIQENNLEKLLPKKGFYKAYHMNKKNWITMILDDTIKDEDIKKQIDESYNLVNKK